MEPDLVLVPGRVAEKISLGGGSRTLDCSKKDPRLDRDGPVSCGLVLLVWPHFSVTGEGNSDHPKTALLK